MSKLLVIYTYGKHCITLHHIVQYIKLPITEPVNSSNRRNKTALVGLQRFTVVKGFRFRIWKLNKNQINENGWICCENPQFSITTYRCAIWKKNSKASNCMILVVSSHCRFETVDRDIFHSKRVIFDYLCGTSRHLVENRRCQCRFHSIAIIIMESYEMTVVTITIHVVCDLCNC